MILHNTGFVGIAGLRRIAPYAAFDIILYALTQHAVPEKLCKRAGSILSGRMLQMTTTQHRVYCFNPRVSGQVILGSYYSSQRTPARMIWWLAACRFIRVPVGLCSGERVLLDIYEFGRRKGVRVIVDPRLTYDVRADSMRRVTSIQQKGTTLRNEKGVQ